MPRNRLTAAHAISAPVPRGLARTTLAGVFTFIPVFAHAAQAQGVGTAPAEVFLLAVCIVLAVLLAVCLVHMQRIRRQCSMLVDNAVEGFVQATPEGRIVSANRAMAVMLGYDGPEELLQTVRDTDFTLFVHPGTRETILRVLGEHGEIVNHECQLRRRDGKVVWGSISARLVAGPTGTPRHIEGFVSDITSRKSTEALLRHQALYDPLTALPNRTLLTDRISRAIERSRRLEDSYYALLFVDVDRLKVLNDSFGHAFGDLVLIEAARRLKKCVRELDTVARFGNDEFVVLLEDIESAREAARVVKRIHAALRAPMELVDRCLQISVCTGVVLHTDDYDSPEVLLRNADTAMHRAKEMGPDRFKVFTPRLHDEAVQAMTLENDLDRGLANEEFFLVFQPIVTGEDGVVKGFEALARWRHPERGVVMPAEFIPVAEETGRIDELGLWVLREACTTVARWRQQDNAGRGLTLSVNMSGRQFASKTVVRDVQAILRETGLPPEALRIELTESVLMDDAEATVRRLRKLRALGVTTSIDDFGTGYSSMSYLQKFPLDNLKIDLSFVQGLSENPENEAIVRSIISLARSLGLGIVAEGVERQMQRDILARLGCETYQGYLFSRPLAVRDAERFLLEHSARSEGPET